MWHTVTLKLALLCCETRIYGPLTGMGRAAAAADPQGAAWTPMGQAGITHVGFSWKC